MTNKADKALLPAGMSDVLAPDAAFEASVLDRLLADFAGHGYDRVEPPLIEFEESLLTGIRIAHHLNNRNQEASLALQLKNNFPESVEYQQYKALMSNGD